MASKNIRDGRAFIWPQGSIHRCEPRFGRRLVVGIGVPADEFAVARCGSERLTGPRCEVSPANIFRSCRGPVQDSCVRGILGGDEPTFSDITLATAIAFSKFPINATPLDERKR